MRTQTVAYLGIGSNLGPRKRNLKRAIKLLRRDSKIEVEKVSSFYESSPVGPSQRNFLNGAVRLKTYHTARGLIRALKNIEKNMGRKKTVHWGPRLIDLDILLFGRKTMKTNLLTIPHPEIHRRKFVLKPLCELDPELRVPGFTGSVCEMFSKLTDSRQRVKLWRR